MILCADASLEISQSGTNVACASAGLPAGFFRVSSR